MSYFNTNLCIVAYHCVPSVYAYKYCITCFRPAMLDIPAFDNDILIHFKVTSKISLFHFKS